MAVALATGAGARAAPAERPPSERPRVGLVLSGGGARGAAHVGVLKVLEEMRIPVDFVAGTSMGSIVGGLYASGLSPDELATALSGVDWNDALTDRSARDLLSYRRKQDDVAFATKIRIGLRDRKPGLPLGLVQGQKLENLLRTLTLPVATVGAFDELPVPFRAVAADLATLDEVVLGGGDLARAMRASMSVPGVFAPVEIDGRLLIDGGVANNLPVDVVRAMGADVVIAIDIGTPLSPLAEITSPMAVTGQMTTGMMERETRLRRGSLGERDLLIVPELGSFGSADFTRCAEIIALGETAARAIADRLAPFALDEPEWNRFRAGRSRPPRALPTVRAVRIEQNSRLATALLESLLDFEAGNPLDPQAVDRDLRRIYGLDVFERVAYRLVAVDDGVVDLVIEAVERRWGPNYLQFGLVLATDFDNETRWDFGARLNQLAFTRFGTELRTDLRAGEENLLRSELYQAIGAGRRWFVAARAEAIRRETDLLTAVDGEVRAKVTGGAAALEAGLALDSWGELRLGVQRLHLNLHPDEGDTVEIRDLDDGRIDLRLAFDTLDDIAFPRRGGYGRLDVARSLETLGADDDVTRAEVRILGFASFGRSTIGGGVEAGGFSDDRSRALPFTLGGFGRLSGLGEERLVGRYFGLTRLIAYRKVTGLVVAALEMPLYAGVSIEAGNVWRQRDAVDGGDLRLHGSLFLGLDTPAGPVYLGGGFGDDHERSAFLSIGRSFY
jgi:NTE family protein